MKTHYFTYHKHRFIDTAPLVSRYDVLAQAVLAFTIAGQYVQSMQAGQKIIRLIRSLTKFEAHNAHLRLKLDMLSNKPWRERVLKELGGMRKLKLWEAAKARIEARAAAPVKQVKRKGPAWLYTAECIAESERLKARKRAVFRANHNPHIVRDRCKVDVEGDFRLAPLPRGERAPRQVKIYTANTIIDYDWNPMPFQKEKGFGPAMVWPIEFYAAMAIEAEILAERESLTSHIQSPRGNTGPISQAGPQTPEREMDPVPSVCLQTQGRDEWRENNNTSETPAFLSFPRKRESNLAKPNLSLDPRVRGGDKREERGERRKCDTGEKRDDRSKEEAIVPTISIHDALSKKEQHDFLIPLPEEALLAGS